MSSVHLQGLPRAQRKSPTATVTVTASVAGSATAAAAAMETVVWAAAARAAAAWGAAAWKMKVPLAHCRRPRGLPCWVAHEDDLCRR